MRWISRVEYGVMILVLLAVFSCSEPGPKPEILLRVEMNKLHELNYLPTEGLKAWKQFVLSRLYWDHVVDVVTYEGRTSVDLPDWVYGADYLVFQQRLLTSPSSDLSILLAMYFKETDIPGERNYQFPYQTEEIVLGRTYSAQPMANDYSDCQSYGPYGPITLVFCKTVECVYTDMGEWENNNNNAGCLGLNQAEILRRVICHEMSHQVSIVDPPEAELGGCHANNCACVMDGVNFNYLTYGLSDVPSERCQQAKERWANLMSPWICYLHGNEGCSFDELYAISQ